MWEEMISRGQGRIECGDGGRGEGRMEEGSQDEWIDGLMDVWIYRIIPLFLSFLSAITNSSLIASPYVLTLSYLLI